jgi:hypothetical protein
MVLFTSAVYKRVNRTLKAIRTSIPYFRTHSLQPRRGTGLARSAAQAPREGSGGSQLGRARAKPEPGPDTVAESRETFGQMAKP